MAKTRAYGADAQLLGAFESVYGTPPDGSGGGVYTQLSFKSSTIGAERPLGYDPLLGQGRDAQDPFYEAISDEGAIEVPIDLRAFGWWLKALLGAPVSTPVKAKGTIAFSALPDPDDTITLNGTVWTFVAAAPAGSETLIQATVIQTIDQLVIDLNASADAEVAKCTYSRVTGTEELTVERDTAGVAGNTFTLAASAATVSAATLAGGGVDHVFTSGGDLPSAALEVGHTALTTPYFSRNFGGKAETLSFDMARTGPANATVGLVFQGESNPAAAADAAPATHALRRFNQGSGTIKLNGAQLANVTGGKIAFSNNLERVESIRDDGLIDGADETEATATGSVDVRFGTDATIRTAVGAETPVAMEYRFTIPGADAFRVVFDLPRVFLPRKKHEVSGPGGVSATYDWRAAKDASAGYMLRATLHNDVAGY
ncbi:phage tail tube protein [Shumkonia mesophila]|uniref:phage tail tube protein n=1 Tax=Shumkonia mesophila TaxID=2838854 RepID=UPI00293529B1|nr:phage tail tube protein [Shumkonia mesophila]